MASEIEKLNRTLRRRRIKRVLILLVVFTVIAVLAYALSRIFLRVETVVITNSSKYESSDIMVACDPFRGQPLLQFDKNKAKEDLETSLPYIKNVTLAIELPDRVRISAIGAVPKYSVLYNDVYVCLDQDFKVLDESASSFPDTLRVEGLIFDSYQLGEEIDMSENIEASVLAELLLVLDTYGLSDRITKIDFSKKYNLSFTLDNILQVEFGNGEDFDKKTEMLLEILSRNPSDIPAVINVRNYSEGRYRALN